MIRLHTRVADDIRAACTHNGVVDTVQESEMRMESPEYANEVRGFYDEDSYFDDPADYDGHDEPDDGDDETPSDE